MHRSWSRANPDKHELLSLTLGSASALSLSYISKSRPVIIMTLIVADLYRSIELSACLLTVIWSRAVRE